MASRIRTAVMVAVCLAGIAPHTVRADPARLELGLHGGLAVSSGRPANDIEGQGLQVRWRLNDGWSVQGTLRQMAFDFERPAAVLGLQQDRTVKDIDAKAKATMFALGLRQDLQRSGSSWGWFWGVDLGTAAPKVPTVSGALEGGSRFDVSTQAGREWIASANLGWRYPFASRWAAELSLHADYHRANWRVTDSVSGRSARIDPYSALGLVVGISASF